MLREECRRLQTHSEERISALTTEVESLRKCMLVSRLADPPDPVTSLPGRASAERAIHEMTRGGKKVLTALFVVDHLASINATFGREVGDDLLLGVASTIANELSDAPLYRWSGPAILAVFGSKANLASVESRAKKIAERRTEKTVQTKQGSQIVSVTFSLRFQQISPDLSPDSIFHTFDTYIATR
jgi:GGDEF domain-containing protein